MTDIQRAYLGFYVGEKLNMLVHGVTINEAITRFVKNNPSDKHNELDVRLLTIEVLDNAPFTVENLRALRLHIYDHINNGKLEECAKLCNCPVCTGEVKGWRITG